MYVNILGKKYKVELLDEATSGGNMGSANRSLQHINVNKNNAKEQQQDTLMHEILHIIDGELKLNLTEDTISRIAVGLFSAGYIHPVLLTEEDF